MSMLDHHEHKHPTHEVDGIVENRANRPPVYFVVLFYGLIIWGIVFMAYFLLSGWSSEKEFEQKMAAHQQQVAGRQPAPAPTVGTAAPPEERESAGAALFADNCAMCHGAAGGGGIGPALNTDAYKYGRSREAVAQSIGQGRPGGMPAFGNRFSAAEIADLAAYVLALK